MDFILREETGKGLEQVVILGAGYDSGAYRFREAFPELRFFEVDLFGTLSIKKRKVVAVLESS